MILLVMQLITFPILNEKICHGSVVRITSSKTRKKCSNSSYKTVDNSIADSVQLIRHERNLKHYYSNFEFVIQLICT